MWNNLCVSRTLRRPTFYSTFHSWDNVNFIVEILAFTMKFNFDIICTEMYSNNKIHQPVDEILSKSVQLIALFYISMWFIMQFDNNKIAYQINVLLLFKTEKIFRNSGKNLDWWVLIYVIATFFHSSLSVSIH